MAIGTAAAIIGGAVISGVAGSKASKSAAKAQQAGVDTATNESQRQFDITTDRLDAAQNLNMRAVNSTADTAIDRLEQGGQSQFDQLNPFATAGTSALQQQQALLGMGGQSEQDAAFAAFNDSPGQKFIRERAQKSLLRNSAAIGGLGGGNVRSALVEQGAGFAAQDFNNQFTRLGDLRTAGQNAATNIGQGQLTTAGNVANTEFNRGTNIGGAALSSAARQGQFGQANASNIGNLAIQGGNVQAQNIQNQNSIVQSGIGQAVGAFGQFGTGNSTQFGSAADSRLSGIQTRLNGIN